MTYTCEAVLKTETELVSTSSGMIHPSGWVCSTLLMMSSSRRVVTTSSTLDSDHPFAKNVYRDSNNAICNNNIGTAAIIMLNGVKKIKGLQFL